MSMTSRQELLNESMSMMQHGVAKQYSASRLRPGNRTANHKPSISSKQADKFASVSRPLLRRAQFDGAMQHINRVAGGEPRSVRRAMARARSKRKESNV